jgi:hypothetical protein
MTIDFATEPLIPLNQATIHVPRRRRGRRTSVSTLHRWAARGLRGIVLETLQVGGTKCTSVAALQRFFERLSVLNADDAQVSKVGCSNQQPRQEVERELDQRWQRNRRRPRTTGKTTQTAQ